GDAPPHAAGADRRAEARTHRRGADVPSTARTGPRAPPGAALAALRADARRPSARWRAFARVRADRARARAGAPPERPRRLGTRSVADELPRLSAGGDQGAPDERR